MKLESLNQGFEKLPYTWERFIPDLSEDDSGTRKARELHLGRYETAKQYVSEKKVLDIACGSGYGSQMLRRAGAKAVVGVDVSSEALEYASKRYEEPGVQFIRSDAEKFEWSEQFDVIVSFETIEHLCSPRDFLERIRNLLTKDGIFLLSAPLGETRHWDPYHLQVFSKEDIFTLLEQSGFAVENFIIDPFIMTRSELLLWGKLYPESSPSMRELLFTRRGWQIIYDFVIKGGLDMPQMLVTSRLLLD